MLNSLRRVGLAIVAVAFILMGTVNAFGVDLSSGAMVVTTSSFGFVPSESLPGELGTPGTAEYGDNAIHDAILRGLIPVARRGA